ncbi:MAG: glycoside hydrolase family 15 protein [Proteobacteria bacterium]|nr:glycoside hydrolase family 15 protein [Pseudomonadota bacterium]
MTTNLDLAVIGNCVIGALIDRRGRIVWSCYPRFDGDPIFCTLLMGADDPTSGFFDITIDRFASSHQAYLGNSAILATTLTDEAGASIRIIDFVPRFKHYGRMFRPMHLVRRIEPARGACRVRVRIRPRFDYGAISPARALGSNHVRFASPSFGIRVTTDAPVSYIAEEAAFVVDRPFNLVLGPDEVFTGSIQGTIRDWLEETAEYWNEWVRYLSVPFEWQDAVIRAAIALKLCSYEETGGIIAAMTTSIPEAGSSTRNWDYRYCWLRDSYFVVHALNRLGATRTMEEYIRFITNVAALEREDNLKPVYAVVPDMPIDERVAADLPGYRGMGPVRVGNQAYVQVQNDAYGSVILAAAQMFYDRRLPQPGDQDLFQRLECLGTRAATIAASPDAGLWEYRSRSRVHTFSALMCWAACSRLAKIARHIGLPDRATHWRDTAARLRSAILEGAWNAELGSFVESFGGRDVDASLLLMHELGFVAASDPRFLGTLAAIEGKLRRGDYLLRYAVPDDFGVPETAFVVCSFWYVDALAAVGRRDEAREIFERILSRRNHLGFLSEDINPVTGELWGNFPQTYSMVGLIVSAMRLSKTWEEAFWRDS